MSPEKLPKYQGRLTSTPWSEITLTESAVKSLKAAALPLCATCAGKGYVSAKTVQICPCVNRPSDLTP